MSFEGPIHQTSVLPAQKQWVILFIPAALPSGILSTEWCHILTLLFPSSCHCTKQAGLSTLPRSRDTLGNNTIEMMSCQNPWRGNERLPRFKVDRANTAWRRNPRGENFARILYRSQTRGLVNDLPSLWCCCCEVEGTVQALATVPGLMIYGGLVETGTDHSLLPTESHFKLANINKAWPASGSPLTPSEKGVCVGGYGAQGFCILGAHRVRLH